MSAAVSVDQLKVMIDYMEAHHEMAVGRFSRTTEGRAAAKRGWDAFASQLNKVQNGIVKSGQQWRQEFYCSESNTQAFINLTDVEVDHWFYSEYKSRTLTKIRAYKASLSASGGGEHKPIILSNLQQRLYNILAADLGEPLHGVQAVLLNPLETVDASEDGDNPETTRSQASSSSVRACAWSSQAEYGPRFPDHDDSFEAEESEVLSDESAQEPERRRRRLSHSALINGVAEPNRLYSALDQLNGFEQLRARSMEAQNVALDRNTRAIVSLATSITALTAAVTSLVEEVTKKRKRDEEQ